MRLRPTSPDQEDPHGHRTRDQDRRWDHLRRRSARSGDTRPAGAARARRLGVWRSPLSVESSSGGNKAMSAPSRAFQDKTVTLTNGLKLHYYEWPGPRPNLVLLHP